MADDKFPYSDYDAYMYPGAGQALATELIGPCFVGWILHFFFFGIVASSAFTYMNSELYKSDSRRTKTVLWTMVLGDFVATGVSFAQVFRYEEQLHPLPGVLKGTNQIRDTNTLLLGTSFLDCFPFALCGSIALIAQVYLTERVSKFFMGRRTLLRGVFLLVVRFLIAAAWLSSVSLTILYALFAAGSPSPIINSNYTFNIVTSIWSFISAFVDVLITLALCLVLRKEIRGFNADTDNVIGQVIKLGLKTGAATSFFALAGAIIGVTFSSGSIANVNVLFAPLFPLSSLYVLSFLSTLAARGANLQRRSLPTGISSPFSTAPRLSQIVIHQTREVRSSDSKPASADGFAAERDQRPVVLPELSRPSRVASRSDAMVERQRCQLLSGND